MQHSKTQDTLVGFFVACLFSGAVGFFIAMIGFYLIVQLVFAIARGAMRIQNRRGVEADACHHPHV